MLHDELDHQCGDCFAFPGEACDGLPDGVFHAAREASADGNALADDFTGGALDLDGDGLPGALDFDDPSNWF